MKEEKLKKGQRKEGERKKSNEPRNIYKTVYGHCTLQPQGHQSHEVQCQWHPRGAVQHSRPGTRLTFQRPFLSHGRVPCFLFQFSVHSTLRIEILFLNIDLFYWTLTCSQFFHVFSPRNVWVFFLFMANSCQLWFL